MAYNPAVPTGSVPLNVDYQNLQSNFQQLDLSFGVNHVLFSEATNNGKHTIVSLLNQLAQPADDTTSGTIYSFPGYAPSGGDHQLYYKSPNTVGDGEQITGNQASTNGFGYFSGILCQWGVKTNPGAGTSGTVTFATANIDFQSSCFAVFTQLLGTSSSTGTVCVTNVTKTSFDFKISSSFLTNPTMYWLAIGV
jgi:hypothetical protein